MCKQATHMGMQKDILQQRCSICASQEGQCPITSAEHTKIHQRGRPAA